MPSYREQVHRCLRVLQSTGIKSPTSFAFVCSYGFRSLNYVQRFWSHPNPTVSRIAWEIVTSKRESITLQRDNDPLFSRVNLNKALNTLYLPLRRPSEILSRGAEGRVSGMWRHMTRSFRQWPSSDVQSSVLEVPRRTIAKMYSKHSSVIGHGLVTNLLYSQEPCK